MTASSPISPAAAMRGALPAAALDARAIVRLSKNPRCQRAAALTLVGSSPGKAMEHVFVPGFVEEQSRFALAKGSRFETVQTDNGAARLIQTLQDAKVIGPADVSVRNIKMETAGIRNAVAAKQRAMALTDEILRRKAAGDPKAPTLVLQAALGIPLGSGEVACVRPDILVAPPTEPMYRPGEMKSYPYLHHLTDQKDIGEAAGQLGVYGMALELRLAHLQLAGKVPTHGVLVLVKPGGLQSIAHLQDIDRDISTARRIVNVRPRTLAEVATVIGVGKTLDNQAAIMRLRPYYSGKCRAFCALHDICRCEADARGNPAILGEEAEALLASADASIQRAAELLRGATPATAAESVLQHQLQTLDAEWRAAS